MPQSDICLAAQRDGAHSQLEGHHVYLHWTRGQRMTRRMIGLAVRVLLSSCWVLIFASACAEAAPEHTTPVFYRSVTVDGLSIFYREAGPANAPTLLMLHGFPSSSRMYEPLFARLASAFHLIAPDYPGFGHSDAPDPQTFAYTFDHIADVIGHFTGSIDATRYILHLEGRTAER